MSPSRVGAREGGWGQNAESLLGLFRRCNIPLAAIADELGMAEGAVKTAASRLRKRYGEILREEIARTVADLADVEDEVRALFAALAR